MKFWTMYLSAVVKQNSSSCGKIPWDLFRPWVVSTKVHTSTHTSVKRHRVWMCYHTKIVSWSFPMSLFVWSTVWCSLLILKMRWCPPEVEKKDEHGFWTIWQLDLTPGLLDSEASTPLRISITRSWKNQVIWTWNISVSTTWMLQYCLFSMVLSWLKTWSKFRPKSKKGIEIPEATRLPQSDVLHF
jgi:hypothetical protein